MKEGVLEQRGCSFQVDKFQKLSTIQGLICIVSDVGVPKLVSCIPEYRVRISGVRASAFHPGPKVSGQLNKGSKSQGVRI